MPGNEVSSLKVKAALWRSNGGPDFVQRMLTPVRDNFPAFMLACDLAEGIRESWRGNELLGTDHAAAPPVLTQDASDPLHVDEPHPHELTIDQAEVFVFAPSVSCSPTPEATAGHSR